MISKVALSGSEGVGKTEVLKKVIEILEKEGHVVGGIITEKEYEGKEPVGLRVIDNIWNISNSKLKNEIFYISRAIIA